METLDDKTMSRPRFLRQLAVGIGAGLGVVAVPALARAQPYNCCPDVWDFCPNDCTGGQVRYWCECRPYGGDNYCTHCRDNTGCENGPC